MWCVPEAKLGSLLIWAFKTWPLNPSAGRVGFCKSDSGQWNERFYPISLALWKAHPGPWTQMFLAREEEMERPLLPSIYFMCLVAVRETRLSLFVLLWQNSARPPPLERVKSPSGNGWFFPTEDQPVWSSPM